MKRCEELFIEMASEEKYEKCEEMASAKNNHGYSFGLFRLALNFMLFCDKEIIKANENLGHRVAKLEIEKSELVHQLQQEQNAKKIEITLTDDEYE